ncbi:MAG TPA: NAD-dependent deacylase [Massilibacterium sp.]|nr:NAD-dependent deacylase [Massilibacterium sp.]
MLEQMKKSKHIVVFTGAGMSTESGLSDFRSQQGLWKKYNPIELATVDAMNQSRDVFTHFYKERIQTIQHHSPHIGHHILAEWQKRGIIQTIITQNVDGYHQQAGAKDVIELHGSLAHVHCSSCGVKDSNQCYLESNYTCNCGGFLRPSIVLFGEMLNEEHMNQALRATEKADFFLVLGSSLEVSPANQFPLIAKERGATFAIINMERTALDSEADFIIQGQKIGDVLKEFNNELVR